MSDELRDKLEALLPCEFCGDPMRVTNAGDFRHVDAGDCLIGQLSWQADERYISKWNTRAKQLVVADGGEGVERIIDAVASTLGQHITPGAPWDDLRAALSLPTSDALTNEPVHADQITAPGRYMAPVDALGEAVEAIVAERRRQITAEGWTPEHDDQHDTGELAAAAACYAVGEMIHQTCTDGYLWPWGEDWWKPADRRRELVKAGALIVAEIERLARATLTNGGEHEG